MCYEDIFYSKTSYYWGKWASLWQLVFSPGSMLEKASPTGANSIIKDKSLRMVHVYSFILQFHCCISKMKLIKLYSLAHLSEHLIPLILSFLVWKYVIFPTSHLKVQLVSRNPRIKAMNLLFFREATSSTDLIRHLLKWSEFILLPLCGRTWTGKA